MKIEKKITKEQLNKIKEFDVFDFRWFPKKEQGWDSRTHCFDGQLVAKKYKEGGIKLVDTYWSSNSKYFTLDDVLQKGDLFYRCNLTELENVSSDCSDYYDQKDIFNLSYQSGCYVDWKKRKGAKKSKEVMLESLERKMKKLKWELESTARDIERTAEDRIKIQNGELDGIYI